MTTLIAIVAAAAATTASAAPHNLTSFEDSLLPSWIDRFRVSTETAGAFTWTPAHNETSLYGTTDLVYVMYSAGLLGSLSAKEKQEWCATINAFQNETTGWYWPLEWEDQNKANWPWHPTHAAVETLALLNCTVAHPLTDIDGMLRNESLWEPFMEEWVTENKNIWGGSQQAQSLPGIMRSAFPAQHYPFYDWFLDFLDNHSDPTTGYWAGETKDRVSQLGGAFHLYHVHSCLAPHRPWPYAARVVDATLASQNKTNGMWRTGSTTSPSFHYGLSYCIDLDGVHSLTRSAQWTAAAAARGSAAQRRDNEGESVVADEDEEPYRWQDVEQACDLYLRTATAQLTQGDNVLTGQWAQNTHLMHGAMFAVAECQTWFPHLVTTRRPWQRAIGGMIGNRSCAYA